ncbi:MAG TPA: DUF4386 domain-containing protein [Mycobacteriales bacterium]|nr:DUF4386 domain-containing protein [Mycobacteriales bacterium]
MSSPARTTAGKGSQHPGPPLAAPATAFAVLFIATLVVSPLLGSGSLPSPFAGPAVIQHYFSTSHHASEVNGFLMFLSAVSLALFSAIALSRLDYLAPNAPGPAIGGVSGIVASVFLAVSAMIQWVLSRPAVTDEPALVRALQYLMFLSGGPAHTAALGFMVFGIAITSWFLRRLPRWLSVVGIVIAAVAVLSTVTMVASGLAPLVPIGRFAAMAWTVLMSVLLPRNRAPRRQAAARGNDAAARPANATT